MRLLYASIMLNLILWLTMLGHAMRGDGFEKSIAVAGVVLAAIGQHWAYHAARRSRRGIQA